MMICLNEETNNITSQPNFLHISWDARATTARAPLLWTKCHFIQLLNTDRLQTCQTSHSLAESQKQRANLLSPRFQTLKCHFSMLCCCKRPVGSSSVLAMISPFCKALIRCPRCKGEVPSLLPANFVYWLEGHSQCDLPNRLTLLCPCPSAVAENPLYVDLMLCKPSPRSSIVSLCIYILLVIKGQNFPDEQGPQLNFCWKQTLWTRDQILCSLR